MPNEGEAHAGRQTHVPCSDNRNTHEN